MTAIRYAVAFDLQPGGRAALRQALAMGGDAEIVLIHVIPESATEKQRAAVNIRIADEVALLRDQFAREVRARIDEGPILRALAHAAQEESPELVFVGMHEPARRRGALGDALARVADVDVVAVPEHPLLMHALTRVVAAVDFDSCLDAVVDEAARVARRIEGFVKLVHVVPGAAEVRDADARLAAIAETLLREGVPAMPIVEIGDPAERIIAATEGDAGAMIVVGAPERLLGARAIVGSVSADVLSRASGPVLIVRARDRNEVAVPSPS